VPFIGAEGERDGRTVEGNDRWRWSTMMVVEVAISGGGSAGECWGGGVVPSLAQKEGKESGLAGVEGEAGRSWAESGVGPEFKRNSFRISIDFRMWQNFGNWHKEI
jgi:hypothetical protein